MVPPNTLKPAVVPHFAILLQLACVGADGDASVPTHLAVVDFAAHSTATG
jgi:hypothetical protein